MQARCKSNEGRTVNVQPSLRSLVVIGPDVPQVGDVLWPPAHLPPVIVREVRPLTRMDGCGVDPVLVLVA